MDQKKHWRACKFLLKHVRDVDQDGMDLETFLYAHSLLLGLFVHRAYDSPEAREKSLQAIFDLALEVSGKDPDEWLSVGDEPPKLD